MKWREQVEGNMRKIGLRKEDAVDQCKWREGVEELQKCHDASGYLHSLEKFNQIKILKNWKE